MRRNLNGGLDGGLEGGLKIVSKTAFKTVTQAAFKTVSKTAFKTASKTAFKTVPKTAVLLLLSGCSWFTDFKQQPKIDPWESAADSVPPRANPQFSVPIYGTAAPGFAYGRMASIAAVDSMSGIANPVAADERSLRNGRMQYAINCSTCHGDLGAGDGPITKFGFPPIVIGPGSNAATRLSDGYLFGIIRNGRGLMPPYNRIEEHDRWDLINYLRAVQGGVAVESGPVALPGITGDKLPGVTTVAPTRPAPHYRPAVPAVSAPAPAPAPSHP